VLCDEPLPYAPDDTVVIYVQVTGETRPYIDDAGAVTDLPVMRLFFHTQ
jgi:hypothetical protein